MSLFLRMRELLPGLSLLLALALATPVSLAQLGVQVHRLEIRDGRVFHDGVEIPAEALPEAFDAAGIFFTFEYSGPVMPAITLNGQVFALEGDRLVALDEAAMDDGARALAVMPAELATPQERRRQAEQAYLQTLSERDRALYERLMLERDMEEEVLRLAYLARRASEPAERQRLTHRLYEQLGEIFDLKQANRAEEIRQVEEFLDVMRQQMQERQALREEIIRQRIRELLVGR